MERTPRVAPKATSFGLAATTSLSSASAVRFVGPVRGVDDFKLLGEFVASGAYKTRKFAEYRLEQQKKKGG